MRHQFAHGCTPLAQRQLWGPHRQIRVSSGRANDVIGLVATARSRLGLDVDLCQAEQLDQRAPADASASRRRSDADLHVQD